MSDSSTRDSFHSRLGFVLAAAGAAIGLGNIWGFPTQAANNGGGAFLVVYLIVTVLLALPALYAEVTIGNQAQTNPVSALTKACGDKLSKLGHGAGIIGIIGALMMLSFYTIVAGWMLAHALAAVFELIGLQQISLWLSTSSTLRNLLFTPIFIVLSAAIVFQGVHSGIERWSARLMPLLLIMMLGLIIYMLQQEGAQAGLALYLVPDFSQITEPTLVISAMGQAFFSLAIGVGAMMAYGSYIPKGKGIGKLVLSITLLDTFIAFIAGLLIIPALFVAQHNGQTVFIDGNLVGGGQLIFSILPTLFNEMGTMGLVVSLLFFSLLSIAALTSTISTTEVPVAYLIEDKSMSRKQATYFTSGIVFIASLLVIIFFEPLFELVIQLLTTILQPLMSLFYFIVIGWLWQRGNKLTDLAELNNKTSLKLLGFYLRFICPVLLMIVFVNVAF
ncbi:sodium-dependent transporter [Colwellia sp. E2M01]|uniref:sodium-dependent transporter n=1 Tax=Colwellia sp. E2M01 TaxID=2841561 RepID=UPI001C091C22|nr:sodium-dependent transporter [Colwellia sp. E2M01]MBU2871931.1 sodium-dependent transporter [Colwellia sp. E2M01]